MKWHNEDKIPNTTGPILVKTPDNMIHVLSHPDQKTRGKWVNVYELYKQLCRAEHVISRFEEWETESCPGFECPFMEKVSAMLKSKGKSDLEIRKLLSCANPSIIGCGVKPEEMCKCWSRKYAKEI